LVFLALLLVLAFHLNGTLQRASARAILQSNLQKSLATGVARIPGARLAQVTLAPQQGKTDVWAVVRTPQPLSPEEVGRLNDLVNRVVGTLRWPHGEVRNYGRNDARRRCLRAPGFSG
jgi:hypothetical protein